VSRPTYSDLQKALFELHDLIGVSLTLKERKAIQDAMHELFVQEMLDNVGTDWIRQKGVIRKIVEQFL
jgi:hypothetical protein